MSGVDDVPTLSLAPAAAYEDGLKSARISMHTPRAVFHSPRTSATFSAGGPLGEPFLHTHGSGVYYNSYAALPPDVAAVSGAQHLPAAYAVVRRLLDPDEAEKICGQLCGANTPPMQAFSKSKDTFALRYPKLVNGVVDMKDAFGRYLELSPEEISSVHLSDIRCLRYSRASGVQERPWHRDDPRTHFNVVVLLSETRAQHDGGTLVFHCDDRSNGMSPSDEDAMPVYLEQGDAVIYSAPRLAHALQRFTADGARFMAVFEFTSSAVPAS